MLFRMVGNFDDEMLPLAQDEHIARRAHSSAATVTLARIFTVGIIFFVPLTFYGLYFPQSRHCLEQSTLGMF